MKVLSLVTAALLLLTGCAAGAGDDPDAPVQTVQVDAANMRFTPAEIEVPVGTRLVIELTNVDVSQPHDLVLDNAVASDRLDPGASQTIDVGVITADMEGWCSVSNHRAMGMTLAVTATD